MDKADVAREYQEKLIAEARARHQALTSNENPTKTYKDCMECGDPLHPVRQKIGAILCTYCQTEKEELHKKKHLGEPHGN